MNVFDEFQYLVKQLEMEEVRYALVGGVAVAFYTEPRFTRDIDLLVDSADYEKTKRILEKEGYFEPSSPWTFSKAPLQLHRFLKVTEDDEMIIDILVALDQETERIIRDSIEAESGEGRIRIATKRDLIRLKRIRNSKQDQADIERLEDGKDN